MANPLAAILASAMMLEHLGEDGASARANLAVRQNLREGRVRTPDLGGTSTTSQVADEIVRLLSAAN